MTTLNNNNNNIYKVKNGCPCIGVEVINLSRVSRETTVDAVALSTELLLENASLYEGLT